MVVGEFLHRRLKVVDLLDEGKQRLEVALVAAAENFGQKFIYHDFSPAGAPALLAPLWSWRLAGREA
jgi:hypothetical protein